MRGFSVGGWPYWQNQRIQETNHSRKVRLFSGWKCSQSIPISMLNERAHDARACVLAFYQSAIGKGLER